MKTWIFLTRWGNYSRRGNYSREENICGNTVVSLLSFSLCNENLNSFLTRWGNYSRRGNYSMEETIWGNTVNINCFLSLFSYKVGRCTDEIATRNISYLCKRLKYRNLPCKSEFRGSIFCLRFLFSRLESQNSTYNILWSQKRLQLWQILWN